MSLALHLTELDRAIAERLTEASAIGGKSMGDFGRLISADPQFLPEIAQETETSQLSHPVLQMRFQYVLEVVDRIVLTGILVATERADMDDKPAGSPQP